VQFVNKSWLKIRDTKATVVLPKYALMRRFSLLKDTGVDGLPKKLTLQGNINVLGSLSYLDRVNTDSKPAYPLQFASEQSFVWKKIAFILISISNEKEKEREAKMQGGEHRRVTTMTKIRLIHGDFYVINRVHEMFYQLTFQPSDSVSS
jgi:hypothetical protein